MLVIGIKEEYYVKGEEEQVWKVDLWGWREEWRGYEMIADV